MLNAPLYLNQQNNPHITQLVIQRVIKMGVLEHWIICVLVDLRVNKWTSWFGVQVPLLCTILIFHVSLFYINKAK